MEHKGIIFIFLAGFILLSSLSILRYEGYNAAILDLGYMSQAVWSASQGDLLLVSYPHGIQSRLTGHSEVIYFLLALFYRILPDPKTLLIIQSILYASAVIPIYLLALEKLSEKKYAIWLSLIYLFYPVAMTAALFDFHGDTLAMPLFFFAFYYMEKKKFIPYSIVLVLILTCKVYIVLPILVLGFVLVFMRKPKAGFLTIVICLIWYCSLYLVRNQLFGGGAVEGASAQAAGYASSYFSDIFLVIWKDMDYRIINGIIVFLPVIFLGLRAPLWMLPGLGLAGGVLLSSGPGPGYDYRFHHYALAVPFFIMAILEGAYKSSRGNIRNVITFKFSRIRSWKIDLKATLLLTITLNILLVQTPLSPQFYLLPYQGSVEKPVSSYNRRDKLKDLITEVIILPEKGVMADIFLAPHMSNRTYLYSTHYTDTDSDGSLHQSQLDRIYSEIEYVVIDIFSIYFDQNTFDQLLKREDFQLVFNLDGLLVFSKEQTNETLSAYEFLDWNVAKCLDNSDNQIQLCESDISILSKNNYQFSYEWAHYNGDMDRNNLVAITRFVGPSQLRVIHVSILEVLARNSWDEEQALEEVIYVNIPDMIPRGRYEIYTAWYDTSNPEFVNLSPNSRTGNEEYIGTLTIE